MLISSYIALPLGLASVNATATPPSLSPPLPIHTITRNTAIKFENLAIRADGQILTTTTMPNASIYQVDPLRILPPTLIYTVPNVTSAAGIVEGHPDIFYVASGDVSLTLPPPSVPSSYAVNEIDMRGVFVLPDGTLTKQPGFRRVANLTGASLLNGVALSRPQSHNLLVADSFRGLIWNVDLRDGSVGVSLNDSTTKGDLNSSGPEYTGVNGLKVGNGTMYWTVTGTSSLFRVPIDEYGYVPEGEAAVLVTSNLTCDDFIVDEEGVAYVAGTLNVITKVSPTGEQEIIAGSTTRATARLAGRLRSGSAAWYLIGGVCT